MHPSLHRVVFPSVQPKRKKMNDREKENKENNDIEKKMTRKKMEK